MKDLDEAQMRVPMTMESLTSLWDMSGTRLSQYLGSLGKSPASMGWRNVAHSLRFVGVLKVGDTQVEPHTKHWYHAQAIAAACLNTALVLIDTEELKATFHPFKAIPLSAMLSELTGNLVEVQGKDHYTSLPLVQWMALAGKPAGPSTVEIVGWTRSQERLTDLVLIKPSHEARLSYLTGSSEYGPFMGRRYNTVLSVLEPVGDGAVPHDELPNGGLSFLP
jgi:hypothetical protein